MMHRRAQSLMWLRNLVQRLHDGSPNVPALDDGDRPETAGVTVVVRYESGATVTYDLPVVTLDGADPILALQIDTDEPQDAPLQVHDSPRVARTLLQRRVVRLAVVGTLHPAANEAMQYTLTRTPAPSQ